jgi:phage terminase large subunit GpA-like protein
MTSAKPKKFRPASPAKMTIGHDVAVALGGHPGGWYWQCNQCNNEQGSLDLVTWARKLVYADDPRARFVTETASFVRNWVARWAEERRVAS